MWWENWIPKSYLTKSSVCGIDCVFGDTDIVFNYTILQYKKNKIDFLEKGKSNELEAISKVAKKSNSPVSIVISGKGVIIKKIIFSDNDSLQMNELINQYLPTINPNEFYIQFYKSESNSGFLCVCRKEQVDLLLKQLEKNKTECVNVFIGPLVCNAISVLTASYNYIYTSVNQINLLNGYVDSVLLNSLEKEIPVLKFDELNIESNLVIPFSAGFSYFTQQQTYLTNDAVIAQLSSNHFENLKIKVFLSFLITVVFVVSGINSVLFFQKFEEDASLQVELNLYESKNAQITQLLDNYQKKRSLIEQTGIFDNKKLSVYADRIAATLPGEIVLKELYFNPEGGETLEDSLIDFQERVLIIKGNCNKSLILNEWVNVLKNQKFVKNVSLENFVFNSEGYLPNFVLKLETE